jgi:predicted phosphodiesterase
MRLAILADSHGNLPALEAVLADIERQAVDGLIVAGDFTGGPQPQETVDRLRSLDPWCVQGNAEHYVLAWHGGEAPESWRRGDMYATLRWSCQRLDREAVEWIAGLPEQRVVALDGTDPIRVVHGTLQSAIEFLVPYQHPQVVDQFRRAGLLVPPYRPVDVEEALPQLAEPVLVSAHSHIPWLWERQRRLVVNVGSAGSPNNGDVRAQYALLDWRAGRWQATLRAVPYDLDRLRAAYRDTGYLAAGGTMARAFLLGSERGANVPGLFAAHVRRLASEVGVGAGQAVPTTVWQRAVDTFDWTAQGAGHNGG